ncbi:MCM family protein [Methanocaldococcus sp.]
MFPNDDFVNVIYMYFEKERKRHPTYKDSKYNKESQYKELIGFLLEKEEVDEAELMLKAKQVNLGRLYLNAFMAIMRKYLGFIDISENNGYKVIKITDELRNAINDNDEGNSSFSSIDEFEFLQEKYWDYVVMYIKNNLISNLHKIIDNKVKISMKELYNTGFMELVDFALSSMENYYKVKDWIEELFNEVIQEVYGDYEFYNIILYDFPKEYKIDINNISSKFINKVVEFEGNIVYASPIVSVAKRYVYRCPRCGKQKEVYFEDLFENVKNNKLICNECSNEMEFEEITEYVDFQELIIQGLPNEKGYAREQRVLYEDTQGVYNGYVRVTGIVRAIPKSKNNKKIHNLIVQAINIEDLDNYTIKLTKEDIEDIKKIAKRKDVIELLSNRLVPEIKGHTVIKKAVFLQQIKGVKKPDKRDSINILLITDPGIGKTVILKKIGKLPGNSYINLPTSTTTSIIGVVEKKTTLLGESFTLKLGIIPRTLGVACIDEFYINNADKKLLEVMESQEATIDKGGIHATIPIQCGYLCACNPKRGRFDRDKPIAEQIDVSAPLLSRFDLIFPIMDEADEKTDEVVGNHIVKVHRAYLDKEINKKINLDYIEVDGVKIDMDFIIKYIHYARQKKPKITDEADEKLTNWYKEMRKKHVITPRQLEGAIRLSEAIAKAKLKDTVDVDDVEEAISIITECLKQVAYDPETGIFDVDKITGTHKREREKLDVILDTIKKISHDNPDILVSFEDILKEVEEKGINEEELDRLLKKLKRLGDIDEPKPKRYRLL